MAERESSSPTRCAKDAPRMGHPELVSGFAWHGFYHDVVGLGAGRKDRK
jgi:hypothetical protein